MFLFLLCAYFFGVKNLKVTMCHYQLPFQCIPWWKHPSLNTTVSNQVMANVVGNGSDFFKRCFIYLFLERRKGRRKTSMCGIFHMPPLTGTWPATQACALTGNWTGDPLLHSLVLNPLSHTSQGWSEYFWAGH